MPSRSTTTELTPSAASALLRCRIENAEPIGPGRKSTRGCAADRAIAGRYVVIDRLSAGATGTIRCSTTVERIMGCAAIGAATQRLATSHVVMPRRTSRRAPTVWRVTMARWTA